MKDLSERTPRKPAESGDYLRGYADGMAEAQRAASLDPCPECAAGKCVNCTGETLNDLDALVPCPCDHGEGS